jgi:hypothetical protein
MNRRPTSARVALLLAVLLGLLALVAIQLLTRPAGAAPAIPATLDVGAARVAITAPITGQYVALCQEADGPSLRGPWALTAGETASVPLHALGVPCWVQASETRAGELMAIYETPRFTVYRAWLPEVSR